MGRNGKPTPDLFGQIKTDAERALAVEQDALDSLAEQTALVRDRANRLKRIIGTLGGEPASKPKQKKDWQPKESTLDRVRDAVTHVKADEFTIPVVEQITGLASGTVQRSLDVLREHGEVRLMGTNQHGGRVYRVMDDAPVT
jgi:hypothetical protein